MDQQTVNCLQKETREETLLMLNEICISVTSFAAFCHPMIVSKIKDISVWPSKVTDIASWLCMCRNTSSWIEICPQYSLSKFISLTYHVHNEMSAVPMISHVTRVHYQFPEEIVVISALHTCRSVQAVGRHKCHLTISGKMAKQKPAQGYWSLF